MSPIIFHSELLVSHELKPCCKGGVKAQDWANMVKASNTKFHLGGVTFTNSNTGSLDLAQSKIFQFRILSKENGLFWPTEHSLTNLDVCRAVFIFYSCNSIQRKIESRLSPLHQLCLVFTI